MIYLDKTVSLYQNVYDRIGNKTTLRNFLVSDKYRNQVEKIRSIKDKRKRSLLKKQLPLVTISGIFEPTRKTENLVLHTGLICIDIDKDDNPHISNFHSLKMQLSNIKEVLYCALSVSGNGYYCILPIKYPQKHKEHFKALQEDWLKYGIVVDKNCKDITRMRGYSFDPEAYINEDALVYNRIKEQRQPSYIRQEADNYNNVIRIVNELYRKGINITENYENWFIVGRVLAHELGEVGRSYFHALSSLSSKYDTKECDHKFDKLKHTHFSPLGTFYTIAKDYGILINGSNS